MNSKIEIRAAILKARREMIEKGERPAFITIGPVDCRRVWRWWQKSVSPWLHSTECPNPDLPLDFADFKRQIKDGKLRLFGMTVQLSESNDDPVASPAANQKFNQE